MSRLIWDSDAIDVVCKEFGSVYCWNCANQDTDDCEDCHRKYMNWSISRGTVESVINGLPFAEPQWIPCSERLPEEGNTTYMVTVDYGEFGGGTGQRFYYGKDIGWDDDAVVAWRPLPKPYERGTE